MTNLTANKNCIAQTSRQHKFRDNANAQRASMTSYTIGYSSWLEVTVNGDILSKNIRERIASRRETRHSNPRLVSISLTPGVSCCLIFCRENDDASEAFRGTILGP